MVFFRNLLNPFASDDKVTKEEKVRKEETPVNDSSSEANEGGASEAVLKETESSPVQTIEKKGHEDTSSISDIGVLAEVVNEVIMDSVAPFTGNDDFIGMSLWVNDQVFHVINKESFKKSLRGSFDSMHLYSLGKGNISIFHGEPTPQDEASPLTKKGIIPPGKLWIRLVEKGKAETKHAKASLSIFQGLGSCKENEYILSTDDKPIYRIGRGAISRKPGSAYRVNDIIIEENNPVQSIQKLNNYVSSSQADIILDDGYFYLKAMPSGCRASGGSPTKIIRDQEPMELRDSVSSYKLKDGDIIELGKSVLLLFRIIE